MSIYAVNKIMFKLRNDDAFKERMQQDPLEVVQEFALSAEERDALTRGDVRPLFEMGAHAYLLQPALRREALRRQQPELPARGSVARNAPTEAVPAGETGPLTLRLEG